MPEPDLTGLKFGDLTVIGRATLPPMAERKTVESRLTKWYCMCAQCGRHVVLPPDGLLDGLVTACYTCEPIYSVDLAGCNSRSLKDRTAGSVELSTRPTVGM